MPPKKNDFFVDIKIWVSGSPYPPCNLQFFPPESPERVEDDDFVLLG